MRVARGIRLLALGLLVGCGLSGWAQGASARVRVRIVVQHAQAEPSSDNSGVVVWLTPVAGKPSKPPAPVQGLRLVQKNKRFEPHMIVATVGSTIDFPNQDPFFHNVFSLYKGKRFDLGFYEAGTSRSVRFDRPGVSFIFCNIHPEMSAVVVALDTPYYAVSDSFGEAQIARVVPGRYSVRYWYEKSSPELLQALSRELDVAGDIQLGTVTVPEVIVNVTHKNKYGQDYDTHSAY